MSPGLSPGLSWCLFTALIVLAIAAPFVVGRGES